MLHSPYKADKARLVLREMADLLALDLVDQKLVTDQLVVTVGYDAESLTGPERNGRDRRLPPKHVHGTINLKRYTSSTRQIMNAAAELFDQIVDKSLLIRRLNITANHVIDEVTASKEKAGYEQLDLFTDYADLADERKRRGSRPGTGKEDAKSIVDDQKEIREKRNFERHEFRRRCNCKRPQFADRRS